MRPSPGSHDDKACRARGPRGTQGGTRWQVRLHRQKTWALTAAEGSVGTQDLPLLPSPLTLPRGRAAYWPCHFLAVGRQARYLASLSTKGSLHGQRPPPPPPPPVGETPPHFQGLLGCGSAESCRGQRHLVGRGHTAPSPQEVPPAHPKSPRGGGSLSREDQGAGGRRAALAPTPGSAPSLQNSYALSRGRPCSHVADARHMLSRCHSTLSGPASSLPAGVGCL